MCKKCAGKIYYHSQNWEGDIRWLLHSDYHHYFFVKNMFMKNATSKGFFYSQPIKLPSFSYTPCSAVSYCVSSCFMHPYVCFIFFLCIKNFYIIWGLEVRDLESGKAFLGSSLLV